MLKESYKLGLIEGWLSTVINIILFLFKFWVGVFFGSVAMLADAWHTLSDSLTSIIVIIGFWASARPADERHPFGHGRAELVAAIVIATLLTVIGFNFLYESINRLRNHQAAAFGAAAVSVFIISVIIKEALAQFSFWAGKKIKAQSLIADAWHHRSDAIASGLIVGGALLGSTFWWIDGVMGVGVSLLIFSVAVGITKEASSTLLGQRLNRELEEKIKKLINRVAPGTVGIHHLHIHSYGEHIELTLHIRLPSDMELSSAHSIGQKIESAIREELKIETTVHIEPLKD